MEDRVYPMAEGDIIVINNLEAHHLEVGTDGMHQYTGVRDLLAVIAGEARERPPVWQLSVKAHLLLLLTKLIREFSPSPPRFARQHGRLAPGLSQLRPRATDALFVLEHELPH